MPIYAYGYLHLLNTNDDKYWHTSMLHVALFTYFTYVSQNQRDVIQYKKSKYLYFH
jgi:hypothetical protein